MHLSPVSLRAAFICALTAASAIAFTSAATVTKGSGAQMCVLTQADFRAFGTIVWTKPTVNLDQGGASAYCVYRGKSGATGGVELDVFYPAGQSADDIQNAFKAVLGSDPGAAYKLENVPGADESLYSLSVPQPGYFPFAANAVRRVDLVFSISLPSSPFSKVELLHLSQIVLKRIPK